MGLKNPIYKGNVYYLTITVTEWVDIFTRNIYKHIIVDSLRYCQQNKNLKLYAWCLMSNHLHLVAEAVNNAHLSDILRDFKKFTSYTIIETIKSGNESRQDWMLYRFAYAAKFDSKVTNYKFWQEGNEPKEVYSNDFMKQKIEYTHQNPVRAEIVAEPEHYLYSSASNYAGMPGLLEVEPAY